jgi:hypothetical protein
MKKFINRIVSKVRKAAATIAVKVQTALIAVKTFNRRALVGTAGETYIDTGVKILIAVVIGALVLAGLYAVFGDVVMPTLEERIRDMFDYAG